MLRLSIFLSLVFILSCFHASAGILSGRIFDTKGQTLPFATVFVVGTTDGTVANASGEYQLTLPAGKYEVTCQYIGFQQTIFKIEIGSSETIHHDFKLADQSLNLAEVIVRASDEDPAYRVIRQAIAKRSFHLKQVKEFQTSIYLKGVLRTSKVPEKVLGQKVEKGELGVDTSGHGIIYLCEEVADYYSKLPNSERTIIHSVKESGNPNGLGFSQLPPVITFYENNVVIISNINPRGHISPIADNALNYYKYRLEGTFQEGRNMIYKIRVSPKRPYEPVFFGTIYIVDGDWAIQSLSLATSTRYGLEKLDTARIDQTFLPLKKDVWVVKSQVFYPVINILGFGINGNFVTVYDNQKVNEPMADTIFNKKIISTYDKVANKKDSAYWEDARPLALEADEVRDYRLKDSMRLAEENPIRADSLRKRGNKFKPLNLLLKGYSYNDSGYKTNIKLYPLLFSANFNSVEGLTIFPQVTITRKLDTGNTLELRTAARYGFSNTHFNAVGALKYEHKDKHWQGRAWELTGEGGKYVYQYNRENPVTAIFNTFTTLVFAYNELKLYERWTGALNFHRSVGNGFKYGGRLAYERRLPLENTTTYTWGKLDSTNYTSNVPPTLRQYHYEAHDAVVAKIVMSYQPGFRYIQYPDFKKSIPSDWPIFSLQYEKGIPQILGSNVDWDKWKVRMDGDLSLKLFGKLSYNFTAGGFLNDRYVGLPDLTHLFGGDDPGFTLASPYLKAFQLAPFYLYSNTQPLYGETHVEYDMQGFLSNKIPGFRQAKLYFILGTNTFYANPDFYFAEAFVSVDNIGYKIYRYFRLDFLKAWDGQKRQYYGIRLGLKIPAIQRLRGGDGDIEW
ncbi:MAG: DUF5686 and carboxypeptidase regulatory-like domain-containing protein [Chitinophagaceae bacterium]